MEACNPGKGGSAFKTKVKNMRNIKFFMKFII